MKQKEMLDLIVKEIFDLNLSNFNMGELEELVGILNCYLYDDIRNLYDKEFSSLK
jgi:hypothetical protein